MSNTPAAAVVAPGTMGGEMPPTHPPNTFNVPQRGKLEGNRPMSFDWTAFATAITTTATQLTAAGVPAAAQTSILSSFGSIFSTAKTKELAICAKILQYNGNPAGESQMLNELLGDVNMPPQAAQVAVDISKNLITPGYDLLSRVAMMENFINAGT